MRIAYVTIFIYTLVMWLKIGVDTRRGVVKKSAL
jgi:hypothetical protein